MVTPLARLLKSVRRRLAESPTRFEINQVLRLFDRAGREVRVVPDPSPVCRAGEVVEVRLGRGKHPTEVMVNTPALPAVVRAAGAEAVVEYVRTRYAAWVAGHPALAAETPPAAETAFARELRATAAAPAGGFAPEFLAFAAGAFRRGGAADLEAACTEYFGVPVRLEPESGTAARLRVGPLTFAEFLDFVPTEGGTALAALLALAGLFLGPAAAPDVLLVVRADEVPVCVPETDGAVVGVACWPHPGGRTRREDAEYLIRNDSFGAEVLP
jgi:Type VI secretion, TssG